ncbi:MAG TPA: hypothetical protein VFR48_01700 [Solirubrobacteraceae bacterium]|nr:hypothetical protein [Solirubrobacteraceae bacterium]
MAYAVIALAGSPLALAYVEAPYVRCYQSQRAVEVEARNMPLEPASGITVPVGSPAVFSGESNHALTFNMAASDALLSSPDIDSGVGTQSGAFYRFASTKATVARRTIYWTASFTVTSEGCESPSTFTTPARTLIVGPTEAELAAAKKQQEEAAVKQKEREERAAAGSVLLDSAIVVKNGRAAAVTLTCSDVATCLGKLTLATTVPSGKGRDRHTKVERIGGVSFSIAAGKRAIVRVPVYKIGRALMGAQHGQLSATLTIIRVSPLPQQTQTLHLRLERRKARKVEAG